MNRLVIILSLLFCFSFTGIAQQKIDVHEYAKKFLVSNYREHILDPKIWGSSDTTQINRRFSLLPLDSSTDAGSVIPKGRTLHIYHLMTNVSEIGLHFIIIEEGDKKVDKVKVLGAKYDYQDFIADLLYLQSLSHTFKIKNETLLTCYQCLLGRYDNEDMRSHIKPLFQDTIK